MPTAEAAEEARSASQVNPVPPITENLVMKPIIALFEPSTFTPRISSLRRNDEVLRGECSSTG